MTTPSTEERDALAVALEQVQPPDPEFVASIVGGAVPPANWKGWADAILAALHAQGRTIARTHDAEDGAALRELREAGATFIHIGDGWVSAEKYAEGGYRTGFASESGPTFAAAADKAREALP
jgi:hypothetical protein